MTTYYPIAYFPPQFEIASGVPASGYVLKAYTAGTSTPISMYTDYTGGTSAGSIALNASGYPVVSSNVVIPHISENYKLALYATQAAADADSGAVWSYDNIRIATAASSVFTDLDVGASGTAGTLDIFPATAGNGKIIIQAANAGGAYNTTITNATMAGSRTYTMPDAGASANFVMSEGTATINGDKTFSAALVSSTSVTSPVLSLTDQLLLDTVSQMLTATVAVAAGAINSIDATITLKDMAGTTVTGVHRVEVYISESSTGIGLTADSASGNLTASTGTILTALTAKKHVLANTDANGVLVLNLVDTAEPTDQYFVFVRPFGRLVVSAASGSNWG